MAEQARKLPSRGYAVSRFGEITLEAFTVLLLVTVAAVFTIGMATAEDRLGWPGIGPALTPVPCGADCEPSRCSDTGSAGSPQV